MSAFIEQSFGSCLVVASALLLGGVAAALGAFGLMLFIEGTIEIQVKEAA